MDAHTEPRRCRRVDDESDNSSNRVVRTTQVGGGEAEAMAAEAVPQTENGWLTGVNAATLGMAALGVDDEGEE
jgi:hypothetical protein